MMLGAHRLATLRSRWPFWVYLQVAPILCASWKILLFEKQLSCTEHLELELASLDKRVQAGTQPTVVDAEACIDGGTWQNVPWGLFNETNI